MTDPRPIAYLIEAASFDKLRSLEQALHGGTDRERDYGHKLWLLLADALPMTEHDVDQTKFPAANFQTG